MLEQYLEQVNYCEKTDKIKINKDKFIQFCKNKPQKVWEVLKQLYKNPPTGPIYVALSDDGFGLIRWIKEKMYDKNLPDGSKLANYILNMTEGNYQDHFIQFFLKELED